MKKTLLALILTLSLNAYSIEEDKQKHIVAGAVTYFSCIIAGEFTDFGLNEKTCLIPVFAFGLGKEVYDANSNGTPDFNDFTATMFVPLGVYTVYSW